MGILSRKKKKVKVETADDIPPLPPTEIDDVKIGKEEKPKKEVKEELSKEDKILQEQIDTYLNEYGKSYEVLDFVKTEEERKVVVNDEIRKSVFQTEVCRLLFAIYCEIKKANED